MTRPFLVFGLCVMVLGVYSGLGSAEPLTINSAYVAMWGTVWMSALVTAAVEFLYAWSAEYDARRKRHRP